MDNPFACTNGHSFTANAKIRARCPQCGAMARRDFSGKPEAPTTEGANTEIEERYKPLTKPLILRQGRTPLPAKKPRTPAQLANDKRLSELRKKASNATKPKTSGLAVKPRVANGLVKTRHVAGPAIPTVNRRPKRTAVAGQLKNGSAAMKPKSFQQQVIDAFGFKLR